MMTTMPRNKTAMPATSVSWRAAALATLTAAAILAAGSARADMAPAQGTAVDGVATVQRMQMIQRAHLGTQMRNVGQEVPLLQEDSGRAYSESMAGQLVSDLTSPGASRTARGVAVFCLRFRDLSARLGTRTMLCHCCGVACRLHPSVQPRGSVSML